MKKIVFIFIIFISQHSQTQDVIFSQGFLVPETLNSSFTGALNSTKAGALYKSQWKNSALRINSNYAFLDTWFETLKTGLGISFLNQTEEGSSYTFNQLNLNFAKVFQLNDSWYFRPSVSVGFGMKSFGFGNLLLEDQININTNSINRSSIDPIILGSKRNFFDFSSSLLLNNENSWIGLSMRHLNKPNISLTENENDPLDVFWSVHAKYYLPILENFGHRITVKNKIYFLLNYMQQGDFNRLDVGGQYVFDDLLSLGITAATVPTKNDPNNPLLVSVNTFLGLRWEGFRFGYSYDLNTTKFINTGGTHEFSVSYDFEINIRKLNRLKCVSYF